MGDFTKGKIYKIINFTDKQIYVGSTVYSLSERIMHHGSKYKWWKSGKTKQYCSSFILFENHGFDNCKIVLLENFSCSSKKELSIREEFHRQKNIDFCVNKIACYQTTEGAKLKAKLKAKNSKSSKKYAERYICECGSSMRLGSKRDHLKTKKHQELLLNNQEKVSSREKNAERYICECGSSIQLGSKTSHLKTKKHQEFLLNNQEKVSSQFKKLLKTYDRFVKRNEKYENVIMDLTFSQYYFRFGSWYRK
jgi:hypothetical protein